jgi:propanol-preferring alcohol dehydrogenase
MFGRLEESSPGQAGEASKSLMNMKAWILNKPAPVSEHPLYLSERAVPTPSDDELLVRVAACGICRTDLHVVEGDLPVRRSPVIPGHQIIGSVGALVAVSRGLTLRIV